MTRMAALDQADQEVAALMKRKAELISRASIVVAAVELKGGDVAAAQADLCAIEELVSEDTDDTSEAPTEEAADAWAARCERPNALVRLSDF